MIDLRKIMAGCLALVGFVAYGAPTGADRALPTATAAALPAHTLASASTPRALSVLPSSAAHPQYGVLLADPARQASDYQAGVRLAIIQVQWSEWEPNSGVISSAYQAQEINIVNGFRAQGFTVGVNLSLNFAPSWVLNLPEGQLVDQSGALSGTGNFEFSHSVRAAADTYISSVASSLPGISYYTVGGSETGEAIYPISGGANHWWAFDKAAQGSVANLPVGTPASPMPGWVPGTSTWNGKAVTTAQSQSWYNWYEQALASSLSWEMTTIRDAGFAGWFELQLVGDGANPWVYSHRIAADLAPESYDSWATLNAGAYYPQLLSDLSSLQGVTVDITSVGDESGTPADNTCTSGDASVNYTTNSAVNDWSSTRWLTYLAGLHGLPVMGESTGQNSQAQMVHDVALAKACGFVAFQWAFDYELYGGGYATISDYANVIGHVPAPGASLSPSSHVFSTRSAHTTSNAAVFTVTNTGTAALVLSAVTESGAGFNVAGDTCLSAPVAPSAHCTVSVTFSPTADTSYSGSVKITTHAGSPLNITVSGAALG